MFGFLKKFDAAWKMFDSAFDDMHKELEGAADPLDSAMKMEPGTEKETVTEETRPDGTRVVIKTVIRRSK